MVGLCVDFSALFSFPKQVVNEDKEFWAKDKEYAYLNLSLIVTFVRHAGEELMGLKKRMQEVHDVLFG